MKLAGAALLSLSVSLAGCTKKPPPPRQVDIGERGDVLRHAKSVTLYRVQDRAFADAGLSPEHFLDESYEILGQAAAPDPQAAAGMLLKSIGTLETQRAKCFAPDMALRVFDGTRTMDFVLCFTCHHSYVYEGGKGLTSDPIDGHGDELEALFAATHL